MITKEIVEGIIFSLGISGHDIAEMKICECKNTKSKKKGIKVFFGESDYVLIIESDSNIEKAELLLIKWVSDLNLI